MRIIAGELRSRRLKSIPGAATRPTTDRLRETLFDILGPRIAGATFLDAYAGTGAVGMEALSRGAAHAVFLERNRKALEAIRHNLAREVSRSEMEDNFAQSKEMGLVLTADNVQKNVRFVCHCCKCCCNLMLSISQFGYPNTVVTSNFLSEIKDDVCSGCGKCAKACPINAIALVDDENPGTKRKKMAKVDASLCLGCGVCALQCSTGACKLVQRGQRVIYPETTFERIMLQCLEKGTLQNQIFANPQRINEKFMRAFVGAFLKLPPVKKALLSDRLRSSFLNAMKDGVRRQGKEWVLDL